LCGIFRAISVLLTTENSDDNSPDINPVGYVVWGIRQAHLQVPDQGRERAAPARQGEVEQS